VNKLRYSCISNTDPSVQPGADSLPNISSASSPRKGWRYGLGDKWENEPLSSFWWLIQVAADAANCSSSYKWCQWCDVLFNLSIVLFAVLDTDPCWHKLLMLHCRISIFVVIVPVQYFSTQTDFISKAGSRSLSRYKFFDRLNFSLHVACIRHWTGKVDNVFTVYVEFADELVNII